MARNRWPPCGGITGRHAADYARLRDNRMQRRLQQIESLPPEERRQLTQLVDAFIERGQLKRRANSNTASG